MLKMIDKKIITILQIKSKPRPESFLLVDSQDFFFRFRVGGTKKNNWSLSELFFYLQKKNNSKISKVNHQSVLNL